MNLTLDQIAYAVKEAEDFLKTNEVDTKRRLRFILLLEDLLLDYHKLYGEVPFRLNCKRKLKYSVVTVSVTCESRDLLSQHESIFTENLLDDMVVGPTWKYRRGKNIIEYEFGTHQLNHQSMKYVWQYMRDEKRSFIIAVILRFVNMVISILEPLLSAWIIVGINDSDLNKITYVALLMLAQGVLSSLINYIASRMLRKSYSSMLKLMQTDLAERILRIRTECMDKSSSGVFTQRLLKDTADVIDGIDELLASLTEAFRLVSLLIAFATVSAEMLVFELILFVIYLIIQRSHSKSLQKHGRVARAADERHSGFVSEMARAHRDIKLLHCENSFMEKISESIEESVDLTSKLRVKSMNFILLRTQFVSWTSCAYVALLALMISRGMPASTALVLYNYNGKVYVSGRDVANLITAAYNLSLSTERIYQLMNSPDYEWEQFGEEHIDRVSGDLEMRNVFFAFKQADGKRNQVLNGVNLHIRAGESVALVGRSGCGKTTLLSLFSRLYDPDRGTVLMDGMDLGTLDQDTIRGSISMVSQMPYLFNMSIRDNLAAVKKDMTDEEMVEVCRIACIHDDIMNFPDGYDTLVGEGGVQISGGQRQRLALARSLLRNTPVIMLDEATSALDNVTQSKISQAIENLRGGRTVIMVAHRLSTVLNCERLFFISEGRVLASGTHQELLESCEEYRQLYGEESKAG